MRLEAVLIRRLGSCKLLVATANVLSTKDIMKRAITKLRYSNPSNISASILGLALEGLRSSEISS